MFFSLFDLFSYSETSPPHGGRSVWKSMVTHTHWVMGVAISPDGKVIMSSSHDNKMQ